MHNGPNLAHILLRRWAILIFDVFSRGLLRQNLVVQVGSVEREHMGLAEDGHGAAEVRGGAWGDRGREYCYGDSGEFTAQHGKLSQL